MGHTIEAELQEILAKWLINHIQHDDADYVGAVKENMMGIIREKKRRKERTGSPVFLITLTKNSNIQLARQTIVSVVCFFIVQTLIFMHETGKISIDFFKECIMQDIPMSRWLSPLMAFCLSFVIMATLAPTMGIQIDRQIDFWLLWFGTMLLLALPVCYLEIALAKRSKQPL